MKEGYIIRKANEEDIPKIYDLLHRTYVEKNYLNTQEEQWEKHKNWYKFLINSNSYEIFLLLTEKNEVIGQIKVELDGEVGTLNIFLKKEYRKQGLGTFFLEEGVAALKRGNKEIKLLQGYILEENLPSKNLFEKSGFIFNDEKERNTITYKEYIREIRR